MYVTVHMSVSAVCESTAPKLLTRAKAKDRDIKSGGRWCTRKRCTLL